MAKCHICPQEVPLFVPTGPTDFETEEATCCFFNEKRPGKAECPLFRFQGDRLAVGAIVEGTRPCPSTLLALHVR